DALGVDLPGRGNVLPTLGWGSRHARVNLAQEKLNEHGAGLESGSEPLDIDGIFGAKTNRATRWFQGNHGCAVDGLIGTETWSALLGYQVMTRADRRARRAGEHHHNHHHA
ncbi:MAG: peptidoglycan hydrolase-like protein with peptidoglycan-binding domain, partial [Myxococcota bacterium]